MSVPRGPTTSGTQACAACKYQRRKCSPDCSLAPYFPPHHQRQFINAHKLFGVSNIQKIIRDLDPLEKDEAMRTMIFQADVRANDPVGGCYRIIHDLQRQIEHDKAELDFVLHQLAICRAQVQQANVIMDPDPLNSYMHLPIHHLPQHQHQHQHQLQQFFVHDNHHQGLNQWTMQDPSGPSSSLHVKQLPFLNECEDIKPLLEMFDERQSLPFDSKESIECSDKVVLKEELDAMVQKEEETNSLELLQEHDLDLKGAASLFTLTNCNT